MKKKYCFICREDLTYKPKVFTYYRYMYPDNLEKRKPMCQKHAKKDLELAHAIATNAKGKLENQIYKELRKKFLFRVLERFL